MIVERGERVYEHQLVRTDSAMQKLDAFIHKTSQVRKDCFINKIAPH